MIIKFYYLKRSLNKKTVGLSEFLISHNIFLHCCLKKKIDVFAFVGSCDYPIAQNLLNVALKTECEN